MLSCYTNINTRQMETSVKSQKLLSDCGALMVPKSKQVTELDYFELVTWLVIK